MRALISVPLLCLAILACFQFGANARPYNSSGDHSSERPLKHAYPNNQQCPCNPSSQGEIYPVCTCDESTAVQVFYTMPNIAPKHANFLQNLDPGFVRYIFKSQRDPLKLLKAMNARTLDQVIKAVPYLNQLIAELSPDELSDIITSMGDIPAYLHSLEPEILKVMINKMPILAEIM